MNNFHSATSQIPMHDLIGEIERYVVDADFDTGLDDLEREFAERIYDYYA
jgi:hypothetical protein